MELREPMPKRCARSHQTVPTTKPKRSNLTSQIREQKRIADNKSWENRPKYRRKKPKNRADKEKQALPPND